MNIKNGIIIILFGLILSSIIFLYINFNGNIKYIESQKVFDGFEYKKKLQKQLELLNQKHHHYLDSIKVELKLIEGNLRSKNGGEGLIRDFEALRREYLYKEELFNKDETDLAKNYDDQIWNQINQFATEYGKKNHLRMIIGAKGDGTIMYGSEEDNITKEFLEYVNRNYNGKK